MQSRLKIAALACAALFAAGAQASTKIDKITVTPATGAKAGEKVKIAVELANVEGVCGLYVKTGDERKEVITVQPDTPNPIVIEHTYKAGGSYKIRAVGDRVGTTLGCIGRADLSGYKVEAGKPVDKAAAAAAGPCPEDWTLKGKVAKDGGFSCVPKKGVKSARKPEKGLECPAGTAYFTKGKTLGCEKE